MKRLLFIFFLFPFLSSAQLDLMVPIDGGTYEPLYGTGAPVEVKAFAMDKYPVTNAQFLEFVKENESWRRSKIIKLFADENYLQDWEGDLQLGEQAQPQWPVTNVSWHAAKNYCECQGKRLPTVDEWEFAAMADESQQDARQDEAYTKYILSWYETPRAYAKEVGNTYENYWGVWDLHGLIWEWTQDFNSVLLTSDAATPGAENARYCAPGAVSTDDMIDYAAFMRYAFRGTQQAPYTSRNLGFRCVQDL